MRLLSHEAYMDTKVSYYKELRIRLPMVLYKKYKLICAERDLSMNKQMGDLVREFVENIGTYVKVLRKLEENVEIK